MSISEDARAMKAVIEQRGWTMDHQLHPIDGTVCLVGAARLAFNLEWTSSSYVWPRELPIRQAIGDFVGHTPESVYRWNDTDGRTKEEVLDMLEDVALKHESDEFRSAPGGS